MSSGARAAGAPPRTPGRSGPLQAGRRRGDVQRHPLDPLLRRARGRRRPRHRLHLPGLEPREDPRARRARRHRRRRTSSRSPTPSSSARIRSRSRADPVDPGQRPLLPETLGSRGAARSDDDHESRQTEMETTNAEDGGCRAVSTALFTALFAGQAALIAMSPVLTDAASDLDVSTAAAGQLRTITGLTAGITALLLGRLAGRVGLGRQLVGASFLLALGSLASAARRASLLVRAGAGRRRRRGADARSPRACSGSCARTRAEHLLSAAASPGRTLISSTFALATPLPPAGRHEPPCLDDAVRLLHRLDHRRPRARGWRLPGPRRNEHLSATMGLSLPPLAYQPASQRSRGRRSRLASLSRHLDSRA